MTLLDRIEAYCLDRRLFTYQDFIMSARLNAKHLAEYADARGIGPGRRAQIQERIDAAKAAFQESRAKKDA